MAWGATPSVTSSRTDWIIQSGDLTVTVSMTAGHTGFFACIIYDSGVDPNSGAVAVNDNVGGQAWTLVWGPLKADNSRFLIAFRENLPSGVTSVTMHPNNGGGSYGAVIAFAFSGGATSAGLDTSNGASTPGPSPWTMQSLTAGAVDYLIIGLAANGAASGGTTYTTPSGFTDLTNIADVDTHNALEVFYKVATGTTGPFAPVITENGQVTPGDVDGFIASFKVAGGGGPSPGFLNRNYWWGNY